MESGDLMQCGRVDFNSVDALRALWAFGLAWLADVPLVEAVGS